MSNEFTQQLTKHSARVLSRPTGETKVVDTVEQTDTSAFLDEIEYNQETDTIIQVKVNSVHLADLIKTRDDETSWTLSPFSEGELPARTYKTLKNAKEAIRKRFPDTMQNQGRTVETEKTVDEVKEERPVKPAPKPGTKTQMKAEVKVKGSTSKPKADKPVKIKVEKKIAPVEDLTGLVSGDKNGLKDVKLVSLAELEELPAGDPPTRGFVESIRLHGVVEPIKVRKTGSPNTPYAVIDGRRRVTAAALAGLKSVRALVEHRSDADEDVVALISNDQRSENLIDQHRHVSNLLAKGKTVKQIMLSTGMSEYEVTRARDLGKLRPELIDAVDKGQMPPAVARHAAMLDEKDQATLVDILNSEKRIKSRDVSAVRRKNQHAAVKSAADAIPELDEEEAEREERYTAESESRLTRAQKRSRVADLAKQALDLLASLSGLDDEETQAKLLLEEAIKRF